MDASELTLGARYAFVSAWPKDSMYPDGNVHASIRIMAGVVSNTVKQAASRGWDITKFRKTTGGGFSESIPLETLLDDNFGPRAGAEIVTVHQDGWSETGDKGDRPTLTYWTAGREKKSIFWRGWDHVITYLGSPEPVSSHSPGHHCIVVPEDRWLADPMLHVLADPGLRTPDDDSPADFERRMRAKRDKAMRGFFV